MVTYNNLLNRFEKFATDNEFVRSFSHGSPSGLDIDKFELYPLMHLVYTGATYGAMDKVYSFEVYILALPPNKSDKDLQISTAISEAEQVAEDLIADLRTGGEVFDRTFHYAIQTASTTPLEETTSNVLSGILLNIDIEVGYDNSSCNSPLN